MSRTDPHASVAGFSLIEALATVALTAMIMVALSSVAGQWIPRWGQGFVGLQRADLISVGIERLGADLAAAEHVSAWGGAEGPLFEGDASSVVLVRSAIGPNARPGLEVVRVAQGADDRGAAFIRTEAPFAPGAPGGPARAFAFADPVALVRAPIRVSLAYAGPDRLWALSWKGQDRLPAFVRITVSDAANRSLPLSTEVSVRVNAPARQRGDARAKAAAAPDATSPAADESAPSAPAKSSP
jgi:general secretion pathway protein J